MEDLEGLILDAEQEIQQKRPLRDLAAKISDSYHSHPSLAALGTAALFVGMNQFPPKANDLVMGALGAFLGYANSFFGTESKFLEFPINKSSKLLRNIAYSAMLSGAQILLINGIEGTREKADIMQALSWSRKIVINYLYVSLTITGCKYFSSGPGVSYLYRQFADKIQGKALKEGELEDLKSAEKCYLRRLQHEYDPHCSVQLLINYAKRDDIRAFEPLHLLVENQSRKDLTKKFERYDSNFRGRQWIKEPPTSKIEEIATKVFSNIIDSSKDPDINPNDFLDKLVEKTGEDRFNSYMSYLLRASFLRGQGETEKARQDLTKAANLLVDMEETSFDDPGFRHSRRGYWIFDFPGARSSLFFQEATPEQAEMATAVYDIMGDKVGEVLDYIPEIGILVQRRERSVMGSNLWEAAPYLDERQLFKTLYNVNESLVVFQGLESELLKKGIVLDVPAEDNPDYYADRMWEVFVLQSSDHGIKIPAETRDEMKDIIYRIGPLMNKYTQVPYWDGNWRNILRILNYSEKLVDFENRCKKGWPIDLISLTEFRAIPEKQKAMLWAQYKLRQGIPIEEFMSGISIGGVIRHSELTGYSWRNYDLLEEDGVEDIVAAIYHLGTASRHSLRSARIFDPGFSNDFGRYAEILQDLAFNASQEYQKEIDEYREMEAEIARQIKRDSSLTYPLWHEDPLIARAARIEYGTYALVLAGGFTPAVIKAL